MKVTEPVLAVVGGGVSAVTPRACGALDFQRWLQSSVPGDRIVYAQAFWLPRRAVCETIALAQDSYDLGLVDFFQLSLGSGLPSRYFAVRIRTSRPANPFVPRPLRPSPGLVPAGGRDEGAILSAACFKSGRGAR